jgi:hypothetical protein
MRYWITLRLIEWLNGEGVFIVCLRQLFFVLGEKERCDDHNLIVKAKTTKKTSGLLLYGNIPTIQRVIKLL